MEYKDMTQLITAISELTQRSIESKVLEAIKANTPTFIPSRSESINELMSALAKAQGEMSAAGLDNDNPYFKSKYADLAAIVKVSRPVLSKNGLAVSQQILQNEEGMYLHTLLAHSSGQWTESRMRILPPKSDIQSIGSYITYLRRYTYASLVGVVAADEDDDGEKAMADHRESSTKPGALTPSKLKKGYETITKEQLEELQYELQDMPELHEEILYRLQLQTLGDLPKDKYFSALERIRKIKVTGTKS